MWRFIQKNIYINFVVGTWKAFSREELIKLVRKQMRNDQNEEDKKLLKTAKKEETDETTNAN
jgi:hypothetical protein